VEEAEEEGFDCDDACCCDCDCWCWSFFAREAAPPAAVLTACWGRKAEAAAAAGEGCFLGGAIVGAVVEWVVCVDVR